MPISLVAHTAFCPRRAWLEAVGEQVDNIAIERGVADHTRVDARSDDRVRRRRSVDVVHEDLRLVGRCDVVDVAADGVRVVEFKAAPIRRRAEVTMAQEVQLALQGLSLESMGHTVVGHSIYFTTQRKMVDVEITDTVRQRARDLVELTRATVESPAAPLPLVDDPRCNRCSHASVCLPDEHRQPPLVRRLAVSDPDGQVLHLTTAGSRASLRKSRVEVVRDDQTLASLPIERVQGLVVHGNVDLSSALIRELLWRRVAIIWASGLGRTVGYARSAGAPNGLPRAHQHVQSAHGRIDIAREMVAPKIANQATQLRRSSRDDVTAAVRRLRTLATAARAAGDVRLLLGMEGEAASIYFAHLPSMLADGCRLAPSWHGRTGRGATDPLNVAFNFTYGLLAADLIRAVIATGLDAHAGFVHSTSRNKPALALDLMEQFRPVVADSVVLGAINNGELKASMFVDVLGSHRLRDDGRRALTRAYERRVHQEFRHPTYRYQVSWRRAMEVQARMVLGVMDGTQDSYAGIRVR